MFAVIPSCSPRFRGESRVSDPWRVARAGSVPPRVSAPYGPRVALIPAAYGAGGRGRRGVEGGVGRSGWSWFGGERGARRGLPQGAPRASRLTLIRRRVEGTCP
ncbi:hypothetical protein GCM10023324_07460 [Streptomyces youssoufiensis]